MIVPGQGDKQNAEILFLGRAPDKNEIEHGIPFSGSAGRILRDQIIPQSGIDPKLVYYDNIEQHFQPFSWSPGFDDLSYRAVNLRKRIRELPNLKVIVPVGEDALFMASLFSTYENEKGQLKPLNVNNWRGSILRSRLTGHKMVPIIHPEVYVHGGKEYRYLHVTITDIARAWNERTSPELNLPKRTHRVIYDTDECLAILNQLREIRRWAFDVETSIRCLGFSHRPDNSWTLVFQSILKPNLHSPAGLLELKKRLALCFTHEHEIITQNGMFDMGDLEANYQIDPFSWHIHSDTMYKHGLLYPELPHSLGFLTSVYTRTPFYKDEGRRFKPGRDPEKKFFEYNGKDCCTTLESDNEMEQELDELGVRDYYYNNLMPLVPVLYRMYQSGVQVDRAILTEIRKTLKRHENIARIKILRRTNLDLNPRSPIDNEHFLKSIGVPPSKINYSAKTKKVKCDEEYLNRLKIDHGHPSISHYLDLRQALYLTSNFTTFHLDNNGRYHATFKLGPKSGRLSCSGEDLIRFCQNGPQLQNIPERGPVNVRRAIVPAPGKSFVHADLSQADARVFAYYAPIKKLIEIYESPDQDSHSVICSFLMEIPRDQIIKGGLNDDKRQVTKMACHAFDYGMRENRLVIQCRAEGIELNNATAKVWRDKYLARFSDIEPHWKWIQEELARTRTLTDLMGRKYIFLGELDEPTYREAYSRVPQGTVGGIMTKAMVDLQKYFDTHYDNNDPNKPTQLIQVHDSLDIECNEKDVPLVGSLMKEYMEIPLTAHGKTFTIPAELAVAFSSKGGSWGKMEKLTC